MIDGVNSSIRIVRTGRSDNSQFVLQTEQAQLRMQGSPVFIAPEAILDRTA